MDAMNDPLARLGGGNHLDDLRAALVAQSEAVLAHWPAKTATITVTHTLRRGQAGDPLVIIETALTVKPPKDDPSTTFYYYTDGELHTGMTQPPLEPLRALAATTTARGT